MRVVVLLLAGLLLASCSSGEGESCDCGPGETCIDGKCEPIEGFCLNDSDCPTGTRCNTLTNRCEPVNIDFERPDGDPDLDFPDEADPEPAEELDTEPPADLEPTEESEPCPECDTPDTVEPETEPEEEPEPVEPRTGLYFYQHPEELPLFKQQVQTFMVSSHDLQGADADNTHTHLYRDGSDYVLLDVLGAGCVVRMWFAEINSVGNLKIYFDNASDPKYDMPIDSYFNNFNPPFVEPFIAHESGAYTSYVPLCFRNRIKIASTGRPGYYQIEYQLYGDSSIVATHTGNEDYSAAGALFANTGDPPIVWDGELAIDDSVRVASGSTESLVNLAGEGVITAVLLDPSLNTPSALRAIRLKAFFDGMSDPCVDAPLAHLFLSGWSEEQILSTFIGMRTDGFYYLYFPMPYWNGARIEIENPTDTEVRIAYEVRYVESAMPRTAGHFYARYTEAELEDQNNYVALNSTGRGHLIGIMLFMRGDLSRDFLNGDEIIWIDGMRSPVWWGTATDNYFNGHLRFMMGSYLPSTIPIFGYPYQPQTESLYSFPAFRFHIGDFIPFSKSIRVEFEHGGDEPVPARYESVAFYYRHCLSNLVLSDYFQPGDILDAQAHSFDIGGEVEQYAHESVCGCFEGTECSGYGQTNGTIPCEGEYQVFSGRAIKTELQVQGYMQFQMTLDPRNEGARLVRVLDYSVQNQNAKVYVDDEFVGYWYTPGRNIYNIWLESGIDLPPSITSGKDHITVRIEYEGGNEWNAYEFSVYSYLPTEGESPGPGAPENLRLVRQLGLTVTIAWDPPRSGTAPLYYHVYRADQPGIPPGSLTHIARVETTEFTDDNDGMGLEPQRHYYYKVVAEDCTGVRGPASEELDVETGLPPLVVEAEDVVDQDNSTPSNGVFFVDDEQASGGRYVCLQGVTGGGSNRLIFRIDFDVGGEYIFSGYMIKRPDGAIVQPTMAGSPVGSEIDLYAEQTEFTPEIEFGTRRVSAGTVTVLFRIMDKNPNSSGYVVCVDKLEFK